MLENILLEYGEIYPSINNLYLKELSNLINYNIFFGFENIFDNTFCKRKEYFNIENKKFCGEIYEFSFKENLKCRLSVNICFLNELNFWKSFLLRLFYDDRTAFNDFSFSRTILVNNKKPLNPEDIYEFTKEFSINLFEIIFSFIKNERDPNSSFNQIFLNIVFQLMDKYPGYINYFKTCINEIINLGLIDSNIFNFKLGVLV